MGKIYLEGSSADEFMAKLCTKISELINDLKPVNKADQEELLTRKEAANMLKITYPTLNNWTKVGILKPHYKGRRLYYKKSEILNSSKN